MTVDGPAGQEAAGQEVARAAGGPIELTADVLAVLRGAGLEAGVAVAEPFLETRRDLEERKAAGLHGGMAFTYRNPSRSTDPSRIVDGARALVVGAYPYLRTPREEPRVAAVVPGRVARYAWTDHYRDLRAALDAGGARLRSSGYRAVVVADDNALVDREAARRAGLGWYGRNANLLLPGLGSWYVLGSIVTDAPLIPSSPAEGGCGSCTRCLSSCPTDAIVGSGIVDARRCLAWLLQAPGPFPRAYRVALGDRIYGCDACQEVCPPNISVQRSSMPPPARVGDEAVVEAATFLEATDEEALQAAGRWYVAERNPRFLRRNALVVLGNTADPGDTRVIGLLVSALAHADPLVRAHAVWAAARIGRPELADGLSATEADPMVREELERRGDVPARAPA